MRTWHKHSCAQWCTGWVWHGPSPRREQEAKCSTAVFPKLCSENSGFSCYNVIPSQRTVALTSCLPLDIKYLLKEDERFFWWEILIGWLWAAYEALLTLLLLSYAQIRENMGGWKCEHWDFKKAKEGTGDSASLRTETLKGTWDSTSLRQETLLFKEQKRKKTLELRF
jgi:hypothetical protein